MYAGLNTALTGDEFRRRSRLRRLRCCSLRRGLRLRPCACAWDSARLAAAAGDLPGGHARWGVPGCVGRKVRLKCLPVSAKPEVYIMGLHGKTGNDLHH